ncbi:peptidoglycan DD-metalloendopeptidase family protein [Streptomyces sp. NBC_00572]|uniref:peptidoglycan DD-metalloendopeptidase family protein n=1 Tax=Streptomyces sp. NBC_00572 TaxID=2903664 RepID=UPI0022538312|nr:peptidoglycan DD-metalloendopeptidase family protein [Streptomyces sp. NBC_00572]MCX4982944.1 peptidoglycan DD-metalloendopeptidase family protein [Streptomyces sp. NBC_00572]
MRRLVLAVLGLALLALGPGAASATASADAAATAAKPAFQMPFPCGTQWQLNSYDSGHDPALDIVAKGNPGSDGRPVLASAPGTVTAVYVDAGAGNVVQIKHSGGWFSVYYHLESPVTAKVGQEVAATTRIGSIGKTGANSGGWAHLHYEQRYLASGDFTDESHRRPVHFDGTLYTGVGKEWKSVTSANCSPAAPWQDCPSGYVCFYPNADGTGSVCRTDRDATALACGLRKSYFNNGTVDPGYDRVRVNGTGPCLERAARGALPGGGLTVTAVRWVGSC